MCYNKSQVKYNVLTIIMIFTMPLLFGCKERGGDVVEVRFWHVMGGPLGKALDELIDEFNEENPDIHVASVSMGNYQALTQKIMASILAGNPPTMAQVYESWTTSLMRADAIHPLEDFIRGERGLSESEISDIFPVFVMDNTWDGIFVTLPFNKSVATYFYNLDLFEREKIGKFPETWDEFLQVALKLTKDLDGDGDNDLWGTAFPVSMGMFAQMLNAKGGSLLSDDETTPTFNSKEGVEAMRFIHDLVYVHKVAYLTTGYEHQDDFIAQNVAMVTGSSVSYSFIKMTEPNFRLAVAPPPGAERKAVFIAGTNIAIFRRAKQEEKEAAWRFIKWFISPDVQARWAIRTGYLPIRESSLKLSIVEEHLRGVKGLSDVWAALDYALIEPRAPGWLVGRRLLSDVGIEPILRGRMPIEETLDRCAEEVQRALTSH